jgi:methanogenic corrinoid protein MtbC1
MLQPSQMHGLNIAALARLTGVGADTLRKWEQRYGVLRPIRTAGGQRRYSERDVQRVTWLRDRVREGYRIGTAAALLRRPESTPAEEPGEFVEALVGAGVSGDAATAAETLEQAFAMHRLEEVIDRIVVPALDRVGAEWEAGRLSAAQEHLVAGTVRTRLESLAVEPGAPVRGTAVLACVPAERHDLGLLMLAALLRADGWRTVYLGADTPLEPAIELAERAEASVLVLSVTMREHAREAVTAFARVRRTPPPELVLGGRGASPELAQGLGARHVGADARAAVPVLRALAT